MTLHTLFATPSAIELREPTAADAEACGRIMYVAFRRINESRGFPPDFPTAEAAIGLARMLIADPAVFGVVATQDGQVIGSNFLTEGDPIRGIGPITVDPNFQGAGVGRRLMQAVIEREVGAAVVTYIHEQAANPGRLR
jgi:predicted N-acetyltransferase YhbS